jgi:N utilization substance protein A
MENKEFVEALREYREDRMIKQEDLLAILKEVLAATLRKKFKIERKRGEEPPEDNFDIIINPDKGDLEIWHYLEVVEDGEDYDPNKQIPLSEAREIEPDAEVGEEISKEIKIEDLGRRYIAALKQHFDSKVAEHENLQVYNFFKEMEGQLYTADVNHVRGDAIYLLDDEGRELILPKSEMIPGERFRKDDTVRGVIKSVRMRNNKPEIILSRTDERFLERLFEQEIPEIMDGIITVNRVARIPGLKAKVAVSTFDDRIDPVGACVGIKGSRIHGIVRELRNENIDVINYTENPELFIQRALSPAKIQKIELDKENKKALIYLKSDEISKAIGKKGSNINLASKLTGYDLNIVREQEEEDVLLTEFLDELDDWMIEALQKIGLDTALSVLEQDVDYLVKKTGLEKDVILEIRRILKKEMEE